MAVTAADHQAEIRRFQFRVCNVVRRNMSCQMVRRHKGFSGGKRQPLGKVHTHQQRPDQSGVCGHGNTVQFRQDNTGIVQCLLYHGQHVFAVPAGGDLRHNAAVLFVFLYL